MRYYFIYILIFLQSISSISSVQAESSDSLSLNYPYINYTTKDGLPSNETFCVFQDSRGYIWIGTDRGLVKYDGYEFKTYTTLDGLTDNVILAINEDDKGNLWYTGLNTLELGYIDPDMNFHYYVHNQALIDTVNSLMYPRIHFNDIYFDKDEVYIVNRRYGYLVINKKGVKFVDIRYNNLRRATETRIVDNENWVFVYSYFGDIFSENKPVSIFNNKNEKIYTYKKKRFKDISPTVVKEEGVKYIYDSQDFIIVNDTVLAYQCLSYLCSAFQIDTGAYIYSTYGYNDNDGKIYYSNSPNISDYKVQLIPDKVRAIKAIKDHNGGIWVATLRNGIFYIPDLNSKFYSDQQPIESILPRKEGLFVKNKMGELFYDFKKKSLVDTISNFQYSELIDIQEKSSFFGYVLVNVHLTRAGKPWDILNIRGCQFISDSIYYFWSAGYNIKVKNGSLFYDLITQNHKKLPHQESLYCFREDSCLYGTRDGIYFYNGNSVLDLNKAKKKRIRHIDYFKYSDVLVYSIWGEGVVLEFHNGQRIQLSDKNGLVSNTINATFMDDNKVLWLGTNKGINKLFIDSISGNYNIETISNGAKTLSSPNILQIYYQDSILYLGTDVGLDVVNLRRENEVNKTNMPIILDSIQVNNIGYILNHTENVLRYDRNSFIFYYTAVGFNMFGQINYRYKLEGLSNEWSYTKERKITFTNIIPGKYNFVLQVKNEYGNWIELEQKIQFKISKPYWETWWFRLLILGVLGYVVYYYISKLKQEKLFLQQEKQLLEDKQQLSDELNESQQKALSSQLNPHFVFNSLNSIQNFILTKRTELSSDYLSMFSKLMRFVFENSKKLYVPLFDEIEALRLYLELEQVRHNHKFKYQINYESIDTHEFVIPALLVQPIIENAIWHGLLHKLEDDRLLEIRFYSNDTHLKIEIKDNGVGRRATASKPRPKFIKKQQSSGVELTKQRLDLLSQSTGLETNFEIIDLFDENKKPKGTLVRIVIPTSL